MSNNYTISPKQAQSPAYMTALSEEIRSGSQMTLAALENRRIDHPLLVSYRARILGDLTECKHYAEWTNFLLKEYGPKKRCLSLGSGLGRVEKHLVESGFAMRFETIDLSAEVNTANRVNDDQTVKGDLNFLELQESSYDFILCHGVLHHLINLEHVLGQINAALRPDGLLLVYEYVGENRWQFSEQRIAVLHRSFPSTVFNPYP